MKAARPDALSRKWEDRPKSTKPDEDDRVKNHQRILLPPECFDPIVLRQLTKQLRSDPETLKVRSTALVPTAEKPIDDLIEQAHTRSPLATSMLACLQDPDCRQWTPAIQKKIKVAMTDYRITNGHIYIRDRLFLPPDDELQTQVIYRTHSSGPGGHPGCTKTLNLLN